MCWGWRWCLWKKINQNQITWGTTETNSYYVFPLPFYVQPFAQHLGWKKAWETLMQAVWLHFVEVTSQYGSSFTLPGCPHLQSRVKSHQDMDVLIISILSTTPTQGAQEGTASRWTSVKGASCQTKHWSRGKGQQQRGTVYVRDTAPRRGSSRSTEQDVLNTDCSRWSKNWLWFQQPVYPNRTELPIAQPCNSIKQAKKHNSRRATEEIQHS